MTQEEKANLVGTLTIEKNALKRDLVCLQTKADRLAQQFADVAAELTKYSNASPDSFVGAVSHPAISTPSADEAVQRHRRNSRDCAQTGTHHTSVARVGAGSLVHLSTQLLGPMDLIVPTSRC